MLKKLADFKSITKFEFCLWATSTVAIFLSCILGREAFSSELASAVGITSLIFVARGEPLGQILMILFSVFYGCISFSFDLYGEMITYMGMTAPISALTLVEWIKNPCEKDKATVKIMALNRKKLAWAGVLTAVVTFIFYFILKFFNTASLGVSTVSVATSFIAAYLMLVRSPFYALGYAVNDLVLISLWLLNKNISMVICFSIFLVNDIYGYISWIKRKSQQ